MNDDKKWQRMRSIIERGGRILLRKKSNGASWTPEYWYVHVWTNLAAGPDRAVWAGTPRSALEFFNLEWAKTIAPLYGCKVVIFYSKKKTTSVPRDGGNIDPPQGYESI